MSGKRKANEFSDEAVKFTGNPNKKRTAQSEHPETVNDASSSQLDSMAFISLHMEWSPNVTSTNRLAKCEDESSIDDDKFLSLAETDRRHLLKILPEDVWRLVFKEVNDSADLENVSNSSLCFRELLLPQRTQFLFHNVCKQLGEAYLHSGELEQGRDTYKYPKTKDWFKVMTNLRLVCCTWSTAVENFFQNHPVHFKEYVGDENERMRYFLEGKLCIINNSLQGAVKMLSHFAGTHEATTRNPFLGRILHIALFEGDEHHFVNTVLRVLRLYGHHIWYTFLIINSFASGIELHSRIENVLRLMPNLKFLKLLVGQHWNPSAKELEELHAQTNQRPLSTLHNLQKLRVVWIPSSIFQEIIRRNAHVSTLIVCRTKTFCCRYDISEMTLPKLKELEIPFYSGTEFLGVDSDLVDWPLTELKLNLEESSDFIDWQQVFNLLENKFKNTLTKLHLTLPVALKKGDTDRIYREGHTFKLNLPQVKSLFVEMGNLSCLDFVLPMKDSITDLQFSVKLEDHEDIIRLLEKVEAGASRFLKLLSCVRRPLESNVWTLFPNLKKIRYTVSSNKSRIECNSVGEDSWVIKRKDKPKSNTNIWNI